MTKSIVLDGIEELPELAASIQEDIDLINYGDLLVNELGRMSDKHRQNFQSGVEPDGSSLAKNAPSTIKQKGHSRVLFGKPSGGFRLFHSLSDKATQSTEDAIREAIQERPGIAYLKFGSAVEYAGSEMAGRRTAYAPQGRPHVGIDSTYLDGMVERAADYTIKRLAAA